MEYGRLSRPDRLTRQAQKQRLQEVRQGQIIQVMDGKAFVIH